MTELKIQIDDSIIKGFGKEIVEHFIQDYVTKALLKLAAKEILEDLPENSTNDFQWTMSVLWAKQARSSSAVLLLIPWEGHMLQASFLIQHNSCSAPGIPSRARLP